MEYASKQCTCVQIKKVPLMSEQASVKIEVKEDIGRIKQATLQLRKLHGGKDNKQLSSWTACMVKVH